MPDFIQRRIDSAVDDAIARGEFDDLPGAGKPLDLPARHDPDWWIKQRLADGDLDRDALLPPVVLLRREAHAMDETLAQVPDEADARAALEDFNQRVMDDRLRNPLASMLAPTLDVDEHLARWRAARAAMPEPEPEPAPASRRRWWARLLGR